MTSSEKPDGLNTRKNLILSCAIRLCSASISTLLEIDTLLTEKKSSLNDDPSQVKIQVVEEMTFGERIGS